MPRANRPRRRAAAHRGERSVKGQPTGVATLSRIAASATSGWSVITPSTPAASRARTSPRHVAERVGGVAAAQVGGQEAVLARARSTRGR